MEIINIKCHCGYLVPNENIDSSNKENEEGEYYCVANAFCKNCNIEYEINQWGEWESDKEAMLTLKDYIEKDIENK